jgi:hypothetical protein
MLAAVLRALLSPILGTVEKIYDRKLTAETESKKLAADLAVKQMEGDQAARLNAAPLALHQALVVYDTMNTSVNLAIPALPAPFNKYQGTILLSFFGLQIGNKVFDTAAYIFGRRR